MHSSLMRVLGLVLGGYTTLTSASSAVSRDVSHSLIPVEWVVQATPDGPYLSLNGTAEEVFNQLREINPNFDSDFEIDATDEQEDLWDESKETEQLRAALIPRSSAAPPPTKDPLDYFAWWQYKILSVQCTAKFANKKAVYDGFDHLKRVSGTPRIDPLARSSCDRVSCSYNSAIVWCTHGLEPKELRSFSDIAIGASAVLARCQGNNNRISGKVFMQDDWFVVIERQSC